MFWALVLESGKQYSTVVEKSFHLSKAALDVSSVRNDHDILSVVFHSDGNEHILCNLSKSHALQESLDLNFIAGSKVVFECKGKGIVHLTGFIVPEEDFSGILDDEDEDLDDESESEVETKPSEDLLKKAPKKPQQAVVSPVKRKQEKQLAPDAKKLKQVDSDDDEDDDDDDDEDDEENPLEMNSDESMSDDDDDEDDDEDDEDDDDDDDDEDDDDLLDEEAEDDDDEDDEDDDDDDDEDDDDDDDEDSEALQKKLKTPNKPKINQDSGQNKKTPQQKTPLAKTPGKQDVKTPNKQDAKTPNKQDAKTPNKQEPKTPINKTPKVNNQSDKKQKTPGNKTPITNGVTPKAKDDKSTPAKTPKTPGKTLEGGIKIEDVKEGNGPVAKPGKFVNVYYVGRLKQNNKQFDASTQGPGFKFRLGKNEVIKGWDIGLNGMKVGGKRRIICPPEMAYGKKGSPPVIPPNSTLVFDVELRTVS